VSVEKEKRLGKHRIGALVYAIVILAGQFHMPSGKGSMCQTSNTANNAPEIGLRKRAQLSPHRFFDNQTLRVRHACDLWGPAQTRESAPSLLAERIDIDSIFPKRFKGRDIHKFPHGPISGRRLQLEPLIHLGLYVDCHSCIGGHQRLS
jgi:hypothetical protein